MYLHDSVFFMENKSHLKTMWRSLLKSFKINVISEKEENGNLDKKEKKNIFPAV